MPLSTDAEILSTSKGLVGVLQGAAGGASEFRPAHAKGHLLKGTFTPTEAASTLSSAPHFNAPSTPLTLRFSSSTGLPTIPDTDPNANPRGIAIRFHLPDSDGKRRHTDIIAHSTPLFPTRTGAEFLEFLRAATGPNAGEAVPEFLGRHPETAKFLGAAKPSPASFAQETYFGVNAFVFVSKEGVRKAFRYRVLPVAEVKHLSTEELEGRDPDYLFKEIGERVKEGGVEFKLVAQLAEEGDVTDNATVVWPEEREVVELGTLKVEKWVGEEESKEEQKKVIFDPIPRVEGLDVSDDPLLDVRANVYLISGKQRREA